MVAMKTGIMVKITLPVKTLKYALNNDVRYFK